MEHLDEIAAPVLLIHGTHDWQSAIRQSRIFFNGMKTKKKIVYLSEIEGAYSDFHIEENRTRLYDTLYSFLNKYL